MLTSTQGISEANTDHCPEQLATTIPDKPSAAEPRALCATTMLQPTAADISCTSTRTASPAGTPRPDSEATTFWSDEEAALILTSRPQNWGTFRWALRQADGLHDRNRDGTQRMHSPCCGRT
ncbi:hypothetical protein GCM10009549_35640 [Streptomyces thermoalcalitolerans]|uniref:Myb-like domain-containing protein n=1 Tax=Streptomyces thermoalcalitolerans TaxID=65605 RepID=A0ABN1NW60_9ACTN